MAKTKIVLDPGHGKYGNAAKVNGKWIVDGFYEGTNNYEAVQLLKTELEKYKDVEVIVTRKNIDEDPSLIDRGAMGRDADLFYSWHSNGVNNTNAYGVSSFSSVRRDGKTLCEGISKAVVEVFKSCGSVNTYNRGYSQRPWSDKLPAVDYYGVLRSATLENPNQAASGKTPIDAKCKNAIIVEHGFHSNFAECSVLNTLEYLKKIVSAEAKVIAEYLRLKEKDTEQVPPDDYYYFVVVSANKNKAYAEDTLAKVKKANDGYPGAYIKYAKR